MPGPLQGLRVVDCSRGTAGPQSTGMLADYGAEVIWVEPPGGDPWRATLAVPYSVYNRGKRSLELDLREEHDADQLRRLLTTADVFVHSWRPGVAERLGLSRDLLHVELPGLVHCSISAFGVDGPYVEEPGFEAVVHALVGTMGEQVGHRDGPIYEGLPFASTGAAYLAVIGILAALYRRYDDGVGRQVETSLFDGALAYLSMLWSNDDTATQWKTGGRRLVSRAYLCADGEYIGIHTGAVGAFDRLMAVVGLADHFSGGADDIGMFLDEEQQRVLTDELPKVLATKPRDRWLEDLTAVDVCALPELHPTQVFDQPQARHNQMVVEVDDPVIGLVEQVAPAARFAGNAAGPPSAAPSPGQHNDRFDQLLEGRPWHDPTQPSSMPTVDAPLLAGVKVLDLGAFYAGPYGSRLLADLGADVIKLEPLRGDQLRGLKQPFGSAQAGKRSIAVDLKRPEAGDITRALSEWADVVQHNMRPGAAERVGLAYEQVKAVNPRVVYAYSPGWGSTGPDAQRQSFAPLVSGYVGVNFEVSGQFNPPIYPAGNEDPGNGLLGASGMLIGLLRRRRTGHGGYVEHPQLNAAMVHVAHIVRTSTGEVLGAERLDPLQMGVGAFDRLYQTEDGWVCLCAKREDHIRGLESALSIDVLADERFATGSARAEHDYELSEIVGEAIQRRSTATVMEELLRAGVPAAVPVPRNDATFLRDPENQRSGRVAERPHPERGHVRELAVLVRVSDSAAQPHQLAPGLGQHTEEILRSVGFDGARIAALQSAGAIST